MSEETEVEEEYFQLIYISSAVDNFSEEELPALLTTARTNNETLDITGMLLFHERSFIQVLTGPEQAVKSVYKKVEKDPRHENPRILSQGIVTERSFEDWSMGFCNTTDKSARKLPGFNNVLSSGFGGDEIDGDRAKKVLAAFRDGQWRQAVNA